MKILLNGWFWGEETTGSGQYLRALVETLPQIGAQHDWILAVGTGTDPQTVPTSWRTVQLGSQRLPSELRKLWFEQVAFPWLNRQIQADVTHVPYWGAPLLPTAGKLVVTVHDLIPLLLPQYRRSLQVRAYVSLVAWTARRAHLILTDSQASAVDIVRHLHVPAACVKSIALAPDPRYQPIADSEQLAALRRKYGLPEQFFLYLGGFDPRKNLPFLLKAYHRYVKQMPESLALVIAGRLPGKPSDFFADVRAFAAELGISQQVILPGFVPEADKPALYSQATAFLFPSTYEGFGLPPLEAMACGTPAVVNHSSSLPEVVGESGWLLPVDDLTAWAGTLQTLQAMCRTNAWAEIQAKALAQARSFSWHKTARETLAVLTL